MNPVFLSSSTNRTSTKSSTLAFVALGSKDAWISKVFLRPFQCGIAILDKKISVGGVKFPQEAGFPILPAGIFLHDLDRIFFWVL